MLLLFPAVIPAQAGTQPAALGRFGRIEAISAWVPACAGMTTVDHFGVFFGRSQPSIVT
jgi:hypothetical protein